MWRRKGFHLPLALCLIAACLYPPPPEPGLTTGRGLGIRLASVFSHKDHKETLKEHQLLCTDCHLYDLAYLQRDRQINQEITKAITRAGFESCHFCHIQHPERVKVSLKCLDCHADIRPIQPKDHRAGWESSHGTKVSLSKTECSQCHSNRFCVRCHSRRDEAERNYHMGSALLSHPIEARADPAKCQKCHQASYCTRCHQFGRF